MQLQEKSNLCTTKINAFSSKISTDRMTRTAHIRSSQLHFSLLLPRLENFFSSISQRIFSIPLLKRALAHLTVFPTALYKKSASHSPWQEETERSHQANTITCLPHSADKYHRRPTTLQQRQPPPPRRRAGATDLSLLCRCLVEEKPLGKNRDDESLGFFFKNLRPH